jgi:hypothetical protein
MPMTIPDTDYYLLHFGISKNHADNLLNISQFVEQSWTSKQNLPYFTTHGSSHNIAILNALDEMLKAYVNIKLTEMEVYLLLISAWLHDIGMLDWDCLSEKFVSEYVRNNHHKRSAKYVLHNARECSLSRGESHAVAWLVKMHRKKEKLEDCPERIIVGTSEIRARLLAAFLRLADALHVDESRTPDHEYSLYRMTGMPSEAKFHWIKSRAVQGIKANYAQSRVIVHINVPFENHSPQSQAEPDLSKFSPLAGFIEQEIETELAGIRSTLAEAGCPILNDVIVKLGIVPCFERGSSNSSEVEELNSIISTDVSPNAHQLSDVILRSILNIVIDNENRVKEKDIYGIFDELKEFAKDLVPKMVARRCHVAAMTPFINLLHILTGNETVDVFSYDVNPLHALLKLNESNYADGTQNKTATLFYNEKLTEFINKIVPPDMNEETKSRIRKVKEYFKKEQTRTIKMFEDLKKYVKGKRKMILDRGDSILVFGFSQSVLGVLDVCKHDDEEIVNCVQVFVAECHAKCKYSITNRVIYNDGLEYAREIKRLGYRRVAIIPDAAVAHLLLPISDYEDITDPTEKPLMGCVAGNKDSVIEVRKPINKVFIGFNGLDPLIKFAIHSCGHLGITLLAKGLQKKTSNAVKPKVYMVGTTNKLGKLYYKHFEGRSGTAWLTGKEETEGIVYYNPLEDIISLDQVDWIISDKGVKLVGAFLSEAEARFRASPGKQVRRISSKAAL